MRLFGIRNLALWLALGLLSARPLVADPAAPSSDEALLPVRLALQWLPQSQFAGFYMAKEQGFYREAGLEVTLLHTGPGPSSFDYMERDKADVITLFLADALTIAAAGENIVILAQFFQRSNLLLVGWRDMGIETEKDLEGRRVSYWQNAFSASFRAFFETHRVSPEVLNQHYTVNLFLERGVVACAAMRYNEYHRIYQAGIDYEELTVFSLHDYGVGFPEDGLYARDTFVEQHPHVAAALRQATLRGWEYARANPQEAVDAVLTRCAQYGVPVNRPHSRWMLNYVLASVFCDESVVPPGQLDADAYHATVQALQAADLIEHAPPYRDFTRYMRELP